PREPSNDVPHDHWSDRSLRRECVLRDLPAVRLELATNHILQLSNCRRPSRSRPKRHSLPRPLKRTLPAEIRCRSANASAQKSTSGEPNRLPKKLIADS